MDEEYSSEEGSTLFEAYMDLEFKCYICLQYSQELFSNTIVHLTVDCLTSSNISGI